MKNRFILATALTAGLAFLPAFAQQSVSYRIREFVVNEGGHPNQGSSLVSSSYHLKLDSIGDGLNAQSLRSGSFRSDAGFAGRYPAPGEAQGLAYTDKSTMVWRPDRSVGTYNVYRGTVESLPGLAFGTCFARALPGETVTEANEPPEGSGWFYLVTAENRLWEEGTKGSQGSGVPRGNPAPCP